MAAPAGPTLLGAIRRGAAIEMVEYMRNSLLTLPLLLASVAAAQQLPFGQVLVVDGVSATLTPLTPPPPLVQSLTVPQQFVVYGLFVSISTSDTSVASYQIATRVETASGARIDLSGHVNRETDQAWTTELFYTGKDPVVKVLTLSIIPLQPNQVKVFSVGP